MKLGWIQLILTQLTITPLTLECRKGPQHRQEQVADRWELGVYSCFKFPVDVSHIFSVPSGLEWAKYSPFGENATGTTIAMMNHVGSMAHAPISLNRPLPVKIKHNCSENGNDKSSPAHSDINRVQWKGDQRLFFREMKLSSNVIWAQTTEVAHSLEEYSRIMEETTLLLPPSSGAVPGDR